MANEKTTKHYERILAKMEIIDELNGEKFDFNDPVQVVAAAYQMGKNEGEKELEGLKMALTLLKVMSDIESSLPHGKKSMLDRVLKRK